MDKQQLNYLIVQQAIELMKIQNEMQQPMSFTQAVAHIKSEIM